MNNILNSLPVKGSYFIVLCCLMAGGTFSGCLAGKEPEEYDVQREDNASFIACETLSSDLKRIVPRIMILLDISSSMSDATGNDGQSKWEEAQTAINGMVTGYDSDIDFGLDLFPREGSCGVGSVVVLDVAIHNTPTIENELAETQLSMSTPLFRAMMNFKEENYAPDFLDGTGGNLVVISDGADSCGTSGSFELGASPAEFEAVTADLRNLFGIGAIAVGFGEGVEPTQLNAITQAGGTGFDYYIQADSGDELTTVLGDIAETVAMSCKFELETLGRTDVNYDLVVVSMDDEQIPVDDGCAHGKGWTWVSNAHSVIEFCDDACKELESGDVVSIKVELACIKDDVIVLD